VTGRPIVGISCCLRSLAFGDYPATPHHTVFHKYVDYVVNKVGAVPVLLPATPGIAQGEAGYETLVERLDGILLTGSPSNVGIRKRPAGISAVEPLGTADHARDYTTNRLIHDCVAARVPLLGICRGMQEINVAFGGDLHPEVHAVPGFLDHRSDKTLPYQQRYLPRHEVHTAPGSLLARMLEAGGVPGDVFLVNSLHGQGVSTLGEGVAAQAMATDGVVEAIAAPSVASFLLGVQWHIEWSEDAQPLDKSITAAFRAACIERSQLRIRDETQ